MRRLGALLVAAGLAVAPSGAVAGPQPKPADNFPDTPDRWSERFEWSTARVRLGVMVTSLTPELRTHFGAGSDRGVLVARVEPKSAAATAGILVGDVIVEVRDQVVDDATDVLAALATTKQGDTVKVQVIRDKQPMTLDVKITERSMPRLESWWPRWFQDFIQPPRPARTAATVPVR